MSADRVGDGRRLRTARGAHERKGTATKASTMAAAATVLVGILAAGTPVRADEDCGNAIKALEDAQLVATKTVDQTMDDIKKATGQPAEDKQKASVKNTFCSVSGEYLGTTRAFRAVAAECLTGNKKSSTLASLDKSIKEMETAIEGTCK
jgi:hypothetical protein